MERTGTKISEIKKNYFKNCDVNLLSKLSIIFKEWRVINNVGRGRVIVLFVL
jgi:hypothetical protein